METPFICAHCHLAIEDEPVDITHLLAVRRGDYACEPCAVALEDADADDRASGEARSRAAYVSALGGISEWGLRLLGMEGEL